MLTTVLMVLLLPPIICFCILKLVGLFRCVEDKGLPVKVFSYFIIGLPVLIFIFGFFSILFLQNPDIYIILVCISELLLLLLFIVELVIICSGDKTNAVSTKSRKVDTLLCFFLGFFGIHRLYEEKYISGILRLVGSLSVIILGIVFYNMNIVAKISMFLSLPEFFRCLLVYCIVISSILLLLQHIDMILILYGDSCDADGNRIVRWNSIESLMVKKIEFKDEKIIRRANNLRLVINGPFKFFCIGAYVVIPVIIVIGLVEKIFF